MIGTLASGIAHDFNNILTGVVGTISLLKESIIDGEDPNELMEYIIEYSGNQAAEVIQQLLSLSRSQEIVHTPIDLNTVLEHVVKIFKGSIDHSITLNVKSSPQPMIAQISQVQMEQVLLNLALNAADAMTVMSQKKKGGNLTISINEERLPLKIQQLNDTKRYINISFCDTGVGIDQETLKNIFTPFYTTKKGKGSGLGMTMVYNIIRDHDGLIDISSTPGVGTTVNIYIPREIDTSGNMISPPPLLPRYRYRCNYQQRNFGQKIDLRHGHKGGLYPDYF